MEMIIKVHKMHKYYFSIKELAKQFSDNEQWKVHFNESHKTYKLLSTLPDCNARKIDSLNLILLFVLWSNGSDQE